MAKTNIYVVRGSEDGNIAARTNARAAILDAVHYLIDGDADMQGFKVQEAVRELKQKGHVTIDGSDLGWFNAQVERFTDQTS